MRESLGNLGPVTQVPEDISPCLERLALSLVEEVLESGGPQGCRLVCFFLFLNRIFFHEIQESVGFLRYTQNLKIPAGKQKNVPVFEAKKLFRF
jgi:hypothetical protein